MSRIEIIEIYGIRINRKEAALLEVVMENSYESHRVQAMDTLAREGSPEVLRYIVNNSEYESHRVQAMDALTRL